MPVACWNLAVLLRNRVSSGSTKRAGRKIRRLAPFSAGKLSAATSARGICAAASPASAKAAPPPTVSRSASRRVIPWDMASSFLDVFFASRSEAQAGGLIEQMHVRWIGGDAERFPRPRRNALAKCRRQGTRADAHLHLRFRASRLDQHHIGGDALLIEPQMLRANAVEQRLAGGGHS